MWMTMITHHPQSLALTQGSLAMQLTTSRRQAVIVNILEPTGCYREWTVHTPTLLMVM